MTPALDRAGRRRRALGAGRDHDRERWRGRREAVDVDRIAAVHRIVQPASLPAGWAPMGAPAPSISALPTMAMPSPSGTLPARSAGRFGAMGASRADGASRRQTVRTALSRARKELYEDGPALHRIDVDSVGTWLALGPSAHGRGRNGPWSQRTANVIIDNDCVDVCRRRRRPAPVHLRSMTGGHRRAEALRAGGPNPSRPPRTS